MLSVERALPRGRRSIYVRVMSPTSPVTVPNSAMSITPLVVLPVPCRKGSLLRTFLSLCPRPVAKISMNFFLSTPKPVLVTGLIAEVWVRNNLLDRNSLPREAVPEVEGWGAINNTTAKGGEVIANDPL